MPRKLRIERAGACYHVLSRGLERRTIFEDERSHERFVELLGEAVELFELRLHAYVLMGNHYHLLLHTRKANLSLAMKWLGQSYTQWFNRRTRRVGPLWQERYKAVFLDWQEAGLEVSRYLHLNPVRVRRLGLSKGQRARRHPAAHEAPPSTLVDRRLAVLREHRWSSYRAYAGLWAGPPWLEKAGTMELVARGLEGEAASPAALQSAYVNWVEAGAREGGVESPWKRVKHQILLGGVAFVREALGWLKGDVAGSARERARAVRSEVSWEQIVAAVEAAKGEPWERFVDRRGDAGRGVALWLGQRRAGLGQAELGRWVGGISAAAVSQSVSGIEARRGSDEAVRNLLQRALEQLEKPATVARSEPSS